MRLARSAAAALALCLAGCAAPPAAHLDAAARALSCCRVCRVGRACGDGCIARDAECSQPPGCACDAP